MSQDQTTKQAYEHAAKMEKAARAEAHDEDELNAAALKADNHTGQEGMMPTDHTLIEGNEIKEVYALLPEWHKDELRRLFVVPRGTRLTQGHVFCDLRFLERGEVVAHGEEEVNDELLVPKSAVDYEIWNKLVKKPGQGE
jgi:hypothetical protein